MPTILIALLIILLCLTLFFLLKLNKIKLLGGSFIVTWIIALSTLIFSNYEIVNIYTSIFSLIVIFFHFIFFSIGYISFPSNFKFKFLPKINISGKNLYNILLTITILGITLLIYTIDLKKYLIANQVANLREDIFSQNISVDKTYKMLANFIYPLSILSGMIFIKTKKTKYLLMLLILAIIFSLLNGGKGSILIILTLFFSVILNNYIKLESDFKQKIRKLIIFVFLIVLFYLGYISISRSLMSKSETDSLGIANEIISYFTFSIPAFSVWLNTFDWSWFNFDISQLSIFREVLNLSGIPIERTIDKVIVYIPEQFNVFTSFADSISAFGLVGSLIYYLLIGTSFKFLDYRKGGEVYPFLFSIFFLFSIYSLFTDIFFFMFGTFICLGFHFLFKINFETN
jgi:oligosaccharide repeat unit polymerase